MKIFRNKKKGIVTREYREAMNTPKRLLILKKNYKELHFGDQTEDEYIKLFKHSVVSDSYCPKILQCNNLYNCCICENCDKFIQVTKEEKIKGAVALHSEIIDNYIMQIAELEMKIQFFKTKEELEKDITELKDKLEKSEIKFNQELEEFKNSGE